MRITLLTLLVAAAAAGCTHSHAGKTSALLGNTEPLTVPTGGGHTPASEAASGDLPGKHSATLCLVMAEDLEKADKDAEAVAYYERARELDPAVTERAGRRLAVLYDKIDQQAKAMTEYQELLKKHPKDAGLLNDLGYSYYNRGQWAEAESHLLRAVAADKTSKRAWVNLGMAQAQLGRAAEAVASFEKAVSPAEAQANLAFVLATRGERDAALAAYRRALALEPTLPVAQAAIARLERDGSAPPDTQP
jgi:Tfp pilus assembly protein PilF